MQSGNRRTAVGWSLLIVHADRMEHAEPEVIERAGAAPSHDSDGMWRRSIDEITDRLERRLAVTGVHRDVVEAAVRSGWARFDNAKITNFQAILAERSAYEALVEWYGDGRSGQRAEPRSAEVARG